MVDPWGGPYADQAILTPDQGGWVPDYVGDQDWLDILQYGIGQAAQTAQVIGAGYPPGSNVTYSPQYQYPQPQPQPAPLPQLYPTSQQPMPVAQSTGGIQLSTTTLMLLVGGVILFILGTKRGR